MHPIASFATLLCAVLCAHAVVLTSSGVYTLAAGSQAIVDASASATTITAPPDGGSTSFRAWTVVVNSTTSTATFQNAVTRRYMAASLVGGQYQIVPANSPFIWTVVPSNGKNKFCVWLGVCLASTPTSSVLMLAIANHGVQEFDANPTTPPFGVYQVQNVATGRIIAAATVPAKAGLPSFPATDRSEVWTVDQTNGHEITLRNYDSGGFLSVQPQGVVVGTWGNSPVSWTIVYVDGVGQILQTSTGLPMTVSGDGIIVPGSANKNAAWVFHPVDPREFIPGFNGDNAH